MIPMIFWSHGTRNKYNPETIVYFNLKTDFCFERNDHCQYDMFLFATDPPKQSLLRYLITLGYLLRTKRLRAYNLQHP